MRSVLVGVLCLLACDDRALQSIGDASADGAAVVLAGQRCTGAIDCVQGDEPQYTPMCLTAPAFPGGYCVQPCAHGYGCPGSGAGMACRTVGIAASVDACFKTCASDGDCRSSEGYRCCAQWNNLGSSEPVCFPGPCPPPAQP